MKTTSDAGGFYLARFAGENDGMCGDGLGEVAEKKSAENAFTDPLMLLFATSKGTKEDGYDASFCADTTVLRWQCSIMATLAVKRYEPVVDVRSKGYAFKRTHRLKPVVFGI